MKPFIKASVLPTVFCLFFALRAPAATTIYVGTNGVSATTNWSTAANFVDVTSHAAESPANNAADFNFNTAATGPGLITVNVDGIYPGQNTSGTFAGNPQAWGMFFGQTNGYHTVSIQPGITWCLTAANSTPGGGNFVVAPQNTNTGSSGAGNSPGVAYTNYTTITGISSTFFANCGVFRVEGQSSVVGNHYTILDMSGLGTFIYTNTSGAGQNLYVAGNGSTRSHALLYFAHTNVITMSTAFQIGNLTAASSNSQPVGVYLGQSNYISTGTGANNLLIGGLGVAGAFMQFNPAFLGGPARPSAYITAAGGNQNAAICSAVGGSAPGSAVCDLTGGDVTWIGNSLVMGVAGVPAANGTLTFDNGLVSFNTIVAGNQTVSAGGAGLGTINIGTNATLQVVSKLTLGAVTGSAIPGSGGIININTNGTLQANVITNGGGGSIINMTNATWSVALTSTNLTNITVADFNATGPTNIINVTSITPFLGGTLPLRFHLITAGSLNGASTFMLVLPASYDPGHPYGGFLDTSTPGLVDLVLTSAPPSARSLTWSGLNGGTPDGDWDVASTPDWLTNSVATSYNQFDLATFNDIASPAQTSINLTTTITPFSVTVSNVASLYTIGGGGNLSGAMGLTKQGTGTLILDNSGSPNDFTGGTTISGGILQVGTNDGGGNLPAGPVVDNSILAFDRTDSVAFGGVISGSGIVAQAGGGTLQLTTANTFTGNLLVTNNSTLQGGVTGAFGAGSGMVIVASGSTLDAKGLGTTRAITVSGTGVGGNGAIVNSGGAIGDSAGGLTPTLTLSGDATFTYLNRWDLGSSSGATLSTGGNAYNLTLDGTANSTYFEWRDVRTDTNLANITIVHGYMGIAGSTTVGNPASSLVINSGTGLRLYSDDGFNASINKQVVLNDSGFIQNGSGASTINGGLAITNSNASLYCDFIVGGTSLTVAGTVTGDGVLYLQGGSSPLIINGNASAFTGGALVNSGGIIVNNVFGSGITSGFTTLLAGSGTVNGPVEVGGTLYAGGTNTVGTFTAAGGLTLDSFATVAMDLSSGTATGGTNNDLIAVTGDLNVNGNQVVINPVSGILASGTYVLMTYTGNLFGSFGGAQTVSSSRYILTLNTNTVGQVQLVVAGNPNNLVWNNGGGDGLWNVQGSYNWTNLTTHVEDQFFTSDSVTLDDTIATAVNPTTSITIPSGTVASPSVVTNNSSTNYTISGAGKISGGAKIVKLGSSTLTINTVNDFTGSTTIGGGTLKAAVTGSLGTSAGTIFVTNGGTLDLDFSLASKPLVLSGTGVGGLGALVNNDPSGTSIFSSPAGFLNVTLAGNTLIGGTNRIDFGQVGIAGAVLNSGGSNYSLTIMGPSYRQWDNVALDANFGDITVGGGTLGLLGLTTLGNATNTLTVLTNATLELFNDNGSLINVTVNKSILLKGGSTLQNGAGTNVILSPIVLGTTSGDTCTNNIGGVSLSVSNVISGPGNLVKSGSSSLILSATNTYTGSTAVTGGTVVLVGNGSISASTNINLAASTVLDASGRADTTLTLASGQTLGGIGTVRGSLTAGSGSTVSAGSSGVGTLTVTNAVSLQGVTAMAVGTGFNNLLNANSVQYGGNLSLSFTPGTLMGGNTFKLFNAAGNAYSGSFASITPTTPGAGLTWDTSQLTVSGTLGVTSGTPPHIGTIMLSGTNLTISGSGGTPNGSYHVWTSTNVAAQLSSGWTVAGGGSFDSGGNFTYNGSINPAEPQRFYILVAP